MRGKELMNIYVPENPDNWIIFQTNSGYYELRLGGVKRIDGFDKKNYGILGEKINGIIEGIITDGEWVYIKLTSGLFLAHGFTDIYQDGKLILSIRIMNEMEFIENYGRDFLLDPGLKEVLDD